MSRDVKIILKTAADITGLSKLKRALKTTVPGIEKLEKGFGSLKDAIGAVGRIGEKTLKGLGLGVTAFSGALVGSIREFATFNVGMARAWTMMDTGVKGFREMRSQVVDLSAELGVAKDELASGLYQALSAGVPEDNVISFISTAAKVAVADGSDIETAVDGITTVLNAWGMEADQADAVTDKLFKTVANGKTTFGQLAASISQAAPVAASMGVSVDELLAGVASLTKQGMPTATAMTAIRNALTITNDTLGDGWSATMSFQEALQTIATQAGHSQQALTKIFGRETVAAISALTGANFSNAASDLGEMSNSGGSLADAFGKVSGETSHWPRLWQQLRAYVTQIGEALDEKLRPAINYITEQLDKFRKGDTFEGFADGLAEGVANFATNLLAGVVTAVQALKRGFTEGPTAIAATLKTLITEALTLAGTAFIEFLRANVNVFMMLGKVVGGAIKSEVLAMDIPGLNDTNRRVKAAAKALEGRTLGEVRKDFNLHAEGKDSDIIDAETAMGMAIAARDMQGDDQLINIAGSTSGADMAAAIAEGQKNFSASRGRLGAQWDQSMANIAATGQNAMGMDLPAMYAANRAQISNFTSGIPQGGPAAAPSASPGNAPAVAGEVQASGQAVEKELREVISITLRANDGTVKQLRKLAAAQQDLNEKINNLPTS